MSNSCKLVLPFIFLAAFSGCSEDRHGFLLCSADGGFQSRAQLRIDPAEMTISGGTTTFSIVSATDGVAIGFVSPFPVMVPRHPEAMPPTGLVWEAGDYSFKALSLGRPKSDWIVVEANPIRDAAEIVGWPRHTTVLYSISNGLIAVREFFEPTDGGGPIVNTYVACGQEPLKLDKLVGTH